MGTSTGAAEERPGSFCVRSREERRGWKTFLPSPVQTAVDALTLILEAPEFLTGQGYPDSAVRVAIPIILPGYRTDRLLLAVDEAGGITLAGCPDAANPVSATMLAGDILALTGRLWRQPLEQFMSMVEEPLGKSLAAAIAERAQREWSDEMLYSGIAQSLGSGRFPVVLVAGEADGGAREAMSYLADMRIAVRFVDIAVFQSAGIEVAAPRLLAEANRERLGPRITRTHKPAPPATVQPRPTVSPGTRPAEAPKQPGTFRPSAASPQAPVAKPEPTRKSAGAQPLSSTDSPMPSSKPSAPEPGTEPRPASTPGSRPDPGAGVPGPGPKPGVMAGKRPPPKPEEGRSGR
jgi:hypothetical protein